jgi:hypothetical protein
VFSLTYSPEINTANTYKNNVYWASKHSTTQATFPSPFCIGYFWNRVLHYAWVGLDCDPPTCASPCSWDDRRATLPSH